MGNPKKRQDKKKDDERRRAQFQKSREQLFMDGVDSYKSEYEELMKNPPFKGILGIYELGRDQFNTLSADQQLEFVGLRGHTHIGWKSGLTNKDDDLAHESVKGTGSTVGTRTANGRIVPVVFVRKEVDPDGDAKEHTETLSYMIRLIVLLHELGHAEDMIKEKNFNHAQTTTDLIEAEAYAHQFAVNYAKRRNYRIALNYYLDNLDKALIDEHTSEYAKLAVKRVAELTDLAALRTFAQQKWSDGGWQKAIAEEKIRQKIIAGDFKDDQES